MAAEPLFFVIISWQGREYPRLYSGALPEWVTGKHAKLDGLIYALRLDTLADELRWPGENLEQHVETYRRLQAAGQLPVPNLVAPRKKSEGARRKLGEWWEPPAPSWDPKAPGEPYPHPDQVKAKPDAPARLREVSE